jgi:ABC-2 type transport system permease protein
MKRLFALTWKELVQLSRDHISMKIIVLMPIMQLIIFGYAINYDVKHLTTVVLDESRSFESRELVAKMDATDYFDVVGRVDSFDELERTIDSARASVGIVIDRDFGKDRHRGAPAKALLIVNASDSTTSSQAMSIVNGIAGGMSMRALKREAGWTAHAMPVDVRMRPWYNPELKTSNFIIPGLIIVVLTFTLINFTANSVVKERELGTLEQLQVTPITGTQLIVGKILPFILIGYVQLTLLVVAMAWLFGVRTEGSMVSLYVLVGLYIAAVLGLGILLSTVAQTQTQATQLSMMCLLPFVFLSGYIFPIGGMPQVFQWITYLVPAKYAIDIVRGVVLRGATVIELWQPIASLAAYTVVIVALAVVRFQRTARA